MHQSSHQMQNEHAAMQGGFHHPVTDSQAVFRTLMDAMARPGQIKTVDLFTAPPLPLNAVAAAILATLADADTPIWLDDKLADNDEVKAWLTFQTGAPFARECADAVFALISNPEERCQLERFAEGTQDYPDRSTTMILQVESLTNGHEWQLSGPGIKGSADLAVAPIWDDFSVQWAANHQKFPRGIDVIFAGADALVALPRTTRMLPRSGDQEEI